MKYGDPDSPMIQFNPWQNDNAQGPWGKQFQTPKLRINPLTPPETSTQPLGMQALGELNKPPDPAGGLTQFRNTPTPYEDQYKTLLEHAPQRQDYQQGKWGKLLSGIAGTADAYVSNNVSRGIKTGTDLMEKPYDRAMQDYATKGGLLKELSGIESAGRKDKIGLEEKISADTLAQRADFKDTLKTASGLNFNDAQMAKLSREMKTIGVTPMRNEVTGKLMAVNWIDGTQTDLGKFFQDQVGNEEWQKTLLKIQHGYKMDEGAQSDAAAMDRTRAQEAGANYRTNVNETGANKRAEPEGFTRLYDLATSMAIDADPKLAAGLFITDPKTGKTSRNPAAPAASSALFGQKVAQQFNNLLGREKLPASTEPFMRDTKGNPIMVKDAVIAAIKQQYGHDPNALYAILNNPDAIRDAEEQFKRARQAEGDTTKPVSLPQTEQGAQTTSPVVTTPPIIGNPKPAGRFWDFGASGSNNPSGPGGNVPLIPGYQLPSGPVNPRMAGSPAPTGPPSITFQPPTGPVNPRMGGNNNAPPTSFGPTSSYGNGSPSSAPPTVPTAPPTRGMGTPRPPNVPSATNVPKGQGGGKLPEPPADFDYPELADNSYTRLPNVRRSIANFPLQPGQTRVVSKDGKTVKIIPENLLKFYSDGNWLTVGE